MDDGKRKTLIEWVNSLSLQGCIESLTELKDGQHLLAVANLIDGIPQQNDIENPKIRWEYIQKSIEGRYQCSMNERLSINTILSEGHEFELAKAALLLMCASMLCERNAVFVDRAMRLDVTPQYEIREMVEWVLQPNHNLHDLDPLYHQVLSKPFDLRVGDNSDLNPQGSSTPQPSSQRSRTGQVTPRTSLMSVQEGRPAGTPIFSTSILERFTSPGPAPFMSTPLSPVQQMVQSPQMANKIRLQQKEHKIKQLERELNSKRSLIADYEAEIEEKRKELDDKDGSVQQVRERLQQALRKVAQLQSELEETRMKDEYSSQNSPDANSVNKIRKEMNELRSRNIELEQENNNLYSQLHTTQDEMAKLGGVRERLSCYESDLNKSRGTIEELRDALCMKEVEIRRLSEAAEHAHLQLNATTNEYRQQIRDLKSQLDKSETVMQGECLGGVMEIQYQEQLAALETELNEYQQTVQQKAGHIVELMGVQEQLITEKSELANANESLQEQVSQYSEKLENAERTLNETIEMSTMWEQKAQLLETNLNDERRAATSRIHDMDKSLTSLRDENSQKENQLQDALTKNQELQQAMADAQNAFSQQEQGLRDNIQRSENQIHELLQKLEEEQGQTSHLKEQLSVKHILIESLETRASSLEDELSNTHETMQRSILHLKEELVAAEGLLRSTQENLSEQLRESKEKIVTADERMAEYAQKLEAATTFGNEKHQAAENLLKEQQEATEIISDMKNSFDALECQNENLEKMLSDQEVQAEHNEMELRQQLQETEVELRQVASQFESVSSQLSNAQAALDAFKERVRELEAITVQVEDQLHVSEATVEDLKHQIMSMKDDESATVKETTALRQELNVECERAEVIEQELMESQQEADLMKEGYLQEIAQLRSNIHTLTERSEASSAMFEKVERHLLDSKSEALRIEDQRARDQQELENAQHHVNELQDELEEAKFRIESLEASIDDYQGRADMLEARLKEFMDETEGEKSTLQVELVDSDGKLQDAKRFLQESESRFVSLQDAYEANTSSLKEVNDELENARVIISQLEAEIKRLTAKLANKEEDLAISQEALFNAEKEKEMTVNLLENSRLSLTGKEDHLGAVQENILRLKEELQASNTRCEELQEALTIHEHKASTLASQLESAETEGERTQMKLEADIEKAEEEMEQMSQNMEKMEQDRDEAIKKLKEVESCLNELKMNNVSLTQQVSELKREFEMKDSQQKTASQSVQQMFSTAETNHNAICTEYEKKIAAFKQEGSVVCLQYENKIKQLEDSAVQAEELAKKDTEQKIYKLQKEHKEELKILGARIEKLTNEHQDLKCWESSERTTIKELEEKCRKLEEDLTKSCHEVVMGSLKVESAEKRLNKCEEEFTAEREKLHQEAVTAQKTIQSLQKQIHELEAELEKREARAVMFESQDSDKEKQLVLLQERVESLEGETHELTAALEKGQLENLTQLHHQNRMEERCKKMEEKVQRSANEEVVTGKRLKTKYEEEMAQQRDEHFEQIAELEIKYQLEVERLEGDIEKLETQLTKTKSELNHKQELLAAVEKKAAAAQNDAHAEVLGLEKEKLHMESIVESLERQLKTVKADYGKAMRLQEVKSLENVELQQKVRRLDRDLHTLMEREKRHLAAHQRETSMGADMNARLQAQLADKETELKTNQDKYQKEVELLTMQLGTIQENYRKQLNETEERNTKYMDQEISRWRSKFEQITEAFNKLEDRHATSESERQRLIEQLDELRSTERSSRDELVHRHNAVQLLTREKESLEERLQERSNLDNQLREEEMLNKRLGNQVRSLEAQLDHATRQLRSDGQHRSLVPPPPAAHLADSPAVFRKALQRAKSTTSTEKLSPKSSPEFAKPYDLRSRKPSEDVTSDNVFLATPSAGGRYLSRLSLAGSSVGGTPKKSPTLSMTSSVFDSARSTRSKPRLSTCSSASSYDSTRSIPVGTGALFHMEDEPVEFEWGRLSELQRRNTLCLPHMKSSYPAEVQRVKPAHITESDLQKGEPLTLEELDGPETRSQSRKRTSNDMNQEDVKGTANSRRKKRSSRIKGNSPTIGEPRPSTATLNGSSGVSLKVYPHYSPRLGGTPKHKLARSSPANGNAMTSTSKKRKSPRGTPKSRADATPSKKIKTPKVESEKKSKSIKTPMAFSIGFTPKKKKLTNFIRRKKSGDTPKGTPKATPKIKNSKKPLGDHN